MSAYYISISISELQQWLVDEELPMLTDRITYSNKQLDANSNGVEVEDLFKRLPRFSLDDSAGVLIVEISGPEMWQVDDIPAIRRLNLSIIKKFTPLTEDARKILSVNWSSTINLSPAVFEPYFINFRLRDKKVLANKSGNLFTNLFIYDRKTEFAASELFMNALPRALLVAEQKKPDEIKEIVKEHNNSLPTWVEYAFGYARNIATENPSKINNIPESIRSFYDVGLLLKSNGIDDEVLTRLREACQNLVEGLSKQEQPFVAVYKNNELASMTTSFYKNGDGSGLINLVTLALFLRWKQAFHEQRQIVDVFSILEDVGRLSEQVNIDHVTSALWMLGAYLGMGYVSQIYRNANKNNYPALATIEIEKEFKAVPAWGASKLISEAEEKPAAVEVKMPEAVERVAQNKLETDEKKSKAKKTTVKASQAKSQVVKAEKRTSETKKKHSETGVKARKEELEPQKQEEQADLFKSAT